MNRLIILGSGASMGVPSLNSGYGSCDPNNPKNNRLRSSTYLEYNGLKLLFDTPPDLRLQLLAQNIRKLDAVFFTHFHADHIYGIDDLREINRISRKDIDIYAGKITMKLIKKRFPYIISDKKEFQGCILKPSMIPHVVKANQPFYIKDVKITPIKMVGHCDECLGYVFDDGEFVFVSDFKFLASSAFKMIKKNPKLMVIPLTVLEQARKHANLQEVIENIEKINPSKAIINHMSNECDFEFISKSTPDNVEVAYDNMIVEF